MIVAADMIAVFAVLSGISAGEVLKKDVNAVRTLDFVLFCELSRSSACIVNNSSVGLSHRGYVCLYVFSSRYAVLPRSDMRKIAGGVAIRDRPISLTVPIHPKTPTTN